MAEHSQHIFVRIGTLKKDQFCSDRKFLSHLEEDKIKVQDILAYSFCELKPHAKFWNPTIPPSGRKVTRAERKKKKKRR